MLSLQGRRVPSSCDCWVVFCVQVSGLAGDDALDLADISYGSSTQVTYLGTHDGGTLTVTNEITQPRLH